MRMVIVREIVLGLIGGAVAALLVTGLGGASGGGGGMGDAIGMRQNAAQLDAAQAELEKLHSQVGTLELRVEALESASPARTLSGDVLPPVIDPLGAMADAKSAGVGQAHAGKSPGNQTDGASER
ncbi:MAG TPA: hypothetical protein VFL92_13160 [Sphingomonas sp.]|nr:hypothetical protein [Sphingomonas sp.]